MWLKSKLKKLKRKILSKNTAINVVDYLIRGLRLFVALGVFAAIGAYIVPNFKDEAERKAHESPFKRGMYVEEVIGDDVIVSNICMTSNYRISENEARYQYQEKAGMPLSSEAKVSFDNSCTKEVEYIYVSIK